MAILPYSQYIYAEQMTTTKEMQWVEVNNNALKAFGGVLTIFVCNYCKQALPRTRTISSRNSIRITLSERNTILWLFFSEGSEPPLFKLSVENAVCILEKRFFHDLEKRRTLP